MPFSRRQLLATLGGVVGGVAFESTLGQAQEPPTSATDTDVFASTAAQLNPPETWPSFQNGPANTGITSHSLSVDDLEVAWNVPIGADSYSPVVGDTTAVVTTRQGMVTAVDTETGATKWSQEYDSRIEGPPVIANGTVYVGVLDRVYALGLEEGDEQWTANPPAGIRAGGTATESSVFFGTARGVARFDADTGDLENMIGHGEVAGAPAVVDGVVYYGSTDGVFAAMLTGREQWQFADGAYVSQSVTVTDDTVFATTLTPDNGTTTFHALDRTDGTENWRFELETQNDVFSAAATDETVFVRRDPTTLEARRVSDGSVEWSTTHEQDAATPTSLAVSADTVFAVFGGSLYALDRETGSQQRSFEGGYAQTPAISNNSLLVVRGEEVVTLESTIPTSESSGGAQPAEEPGSTASQLDVPSGVPTGWFGPLIGGTLTAAYTGVWRRSKARRDEYTVSSTTRRLSMLGWVAVVMLVAGAVGLATAAPEMLTPRLTTAGITAGVVIAIALGGVGAAIAGSTRAFHYTVFGVASAIAGVFLGWTLPTRFWPPASLVSVPSWLLVAVLAGILIITGNTAILSWWRGGSATAHPSQPTDASDDDEADTATDQDGDGEPAADDEEPSVDELWGKADRHLIAADDIREDDPQAALEEYEQAAELFDKLVDRVSDSDDRYEELTAGQTFAHDQVELLRDALDQ
ncbi:PQQ-binding-like beta-propeller repeat protein [Haloferax sp. ATB1]|uniref:outer membrane protein assembly factor BamB family protein n=1 Tax=Haloferax sp. ATB1 TaxID=1508454 RepID=UPI0005B21242|nr:PQQ-binding-like beta-propeller repeat protein [Haloferax sp. ATB1]